MRKRFALVMLLLVIACGQFVIFAQDGESQSFGRSLLTLLITASPLLLFFVFFFWYVRKVGFARLGDYQKRHREHMDRVEKQLDHIREILDRQRNRE